MRSSSYVSLRFHPILLGGIMAKSGMRDTSSLLCNGLGKEYVHTFTSS